MGEIDPPAASPAGPPSAPPNSTPAEQPAPPPPASSPTNTTANNSRPTRTRAQPERLQPAMKGQRHASSTPDPITGVPFESLIKGNKQQRKSRFVNLIVALANAATEMDPTTPPTNAPVVYDTPKDLVAALKGPQSAQWMEAYIAERTQLLKLGVYEVVEYPDPDQFRQKPHILKSKLVFKVKYLADGSLDKFKVRLVCTGYNMVYGEQYRETFAPVASISTIRIFLAWSIQLGLLPACIDISGAYCKADMDDEYQIYMHPPKGCEEELGKNGKPKLWKLKKYLYGLKSSGWAWHRKLHTYLISELKFVPCTYDPCLLQKITPDGVIVVLTYVDDLPHAASTPQLLNWFKTKLEDEFGTLTSGPLDWLLGIGIKYDNAAGTCSMNQEQFIKDNVARLGLQNEPAVDTPALANFAPDAPAPHELLSPEDQHTYQSVVGSLNYIVKQTRLDVAAIVSILAQFLTGATKKHMKAALRVWIYLRDRASENLVYRRQDKHANVPMAWCDASFAPGGKTGCGWRRSRSGIVITLNGAAVVWLSRSQTCVAMSTCEAEYIALSNCCQEAVWVRGVLAFLRIPANGPMVIHEDTEAAAAIANADAETTIKRTKAVDVRFHYAREKVEQGIVAVVACRTDLMLADILTKCLGPDKQSLFWNALRGADHAYDKTVNTTIVNEEEYDEAYLEL